MGAEIFTDQFNAPGDFRTANVLVYGLGSPAVNFPASFDQFARMEDGYEERFTLNEAPRFDFGPATQLRIVDDCDVLRANAANVHGGEAYCLLNELQVISSDGS